MFTRVHNAALSLIDENSLKSRQMADKNLQTIQNIISLVIQKSLVEKITLINSNLLVSSILAVFESECRFKILGSIYLNIFCKYILPERRNWGQLNKEHWIGKLIFLVCPKGI